MVMQLIRWMETHPGKAGSLGGWYQQGMSIAMALILVPQVILLLPAAEAGLWFTFQSLIIFFLILFGCKEEIEPFVAVDIGFGFYPLEIGLYRTYEVNEIDFQISGFDTSLFYLREVLIDSFRTEDQLTFLLQREVASDTSFNWQIDSLWLVRQEKERIVLIQNNIPVVILSFRVKAGRVWNGNLFNSIDRDDFSYDEADFDELQVDKTITGEVDLIKVIINDIPRNIVNQNEQWEDYGKEIGLIEKKSIILNFCTVECDSSGQIESGRFLSQHLIDYGSI